MTNARRKSLMLSLAVAGATASMAGFSAQAASFSWLNFTGGTYDWNTAGNWAGGGFPVAASDEANIEGVITGGPLNINISSDVHVATLTMGGTGAFATTIGSSGGSLIIDNGGASVNHLLRTSGPVGITNVISAPVQITNNPGLDLSTVLITGNNNLTFTGPITNAVDNDVNDGTQGLTRSILYAVTGGTVTYNAINLSQAGAISGGTLILGVGRVPNATEDTGDDLAAENVSMVLNGVVSNGATGSRLVIGNNNTTVRGTGLTPPTVYLRSANTHTGGTVLGRGRFVMENDQAFGSVTFTGGHILQNSIAQSYHTEFRSNSDSRTIANPIQMQQHLAFGGEHSMKFTGALYQTNSRALVNLLPSGKTLTFEGLIAATEKTDTSRPITFDGSGTTILNGPIYNHRAPWVPGYSSLDFNENQSASELTKRGPGFLIVNPTILPTLGTGSATTTGPSSTYRGQTLIVGGLLQFANSKAYGKLDADYNSGTFATRYFDEAFLENVDTTTSISVSAANTGTTRISVANGGAVALSTGLNDADFLMRLDAGTLNGNAGVTGQGNTGALALSAADATLNFNYNPGTGNASTIDMSSANRLRMSIGAAAEGTTYTGTITLGLFDTSYRLGGGGKLTIPGTNKLTGGKNVVVTNGGTVALTGTNNYTNSTIIGGNYLQSGTKFAMDNSGVREYALFNPSTLEINSITDAGTVSSIGSVSAAANTANRLTINGGILRYVGPTASTNRLFTVGTTGATIDASGTGTLNFTNSGSISVTDAADRRGNLVTGSGARVITGIANIEDLAPGMVVDDVIEGSNSTGTYLNSTNPVSITGIVPVIDASFNQAGQVNISAGAGGSLSNAMLTFTNQDRALNLAGSNTGDNTMGVILRDSVKGQLGITKSGVGKWVVTGNNTHTGTTSLNGGTLQFNTLANIGLDTYSEGSISNGATKVTFDGGALLWGPGNTADISQRVLKINKSGGTFDTGANSVNFANAIGDDGSGALHKQGSGRLTLNQVSSYTGGTNVHQGTLEIKHPQGLGFGVTQKPGGNVGTTTVNTGVLDISGQTLTEAITLNGGTLGNSGGSATITSGVKGVAIIKGGSDITAGATVSFGAGGAAADVDLGLTDAAITIANPGGEYLNAPDVTITGGLGAGGVAATAEAVMQNTESGGGSFQNVATIRITNPGSGYIGAPTITIAPPAGGGGSQAQATADAAHFTLVGLTQTAAGSGYLSGATATFNSATGSLSVQLGTPITSSVTLLSSSSIGGSGDINVLGTVSGAGALNKVGSGTVILNNASYTGGTTVKQGRLHLKGTAAWTPSLSGTGTDVQGGAVIYDYSGGGVSPQSTVVPVLTANRATNFASGIVRSSTADATTGLGWKDTASQFTVAHTYYGDIDLNFVVDSVDFNAFVAAGNYGKLTGAIWANGDFDYNGKVNTIDFNWLAGNFGQPALGGALPSAALGAVVPEPASLGLVGLALTALMGRRRR